MITLTTGVPGSGKTLYTIQQVKQIAEKEGRPVFYFGIPDLTLDWELMESGKVWDECPAGSIIVIDECQREFRPRGAGGAVPAYVQAFETHRHKGLDIYLITQHPMLVDQNIRRLVGQHWHVVRKFGMSRATIHQWGSTHEITQRNLLAAVRTQFSYPKEVFSYYKSAEVHTHKAKVPLRVWFLLASPLLVGVLGYFGYTKATSMNKPSDSEIVQHITGESTVSGNLTANKHQTAKQYFEESQPRLAGFAYTAPKYDEITKPVDAPFPQACLITTRYVEGKKVEKCGCIDQQSNRYAVDLATCKQIALNGIFKDWGLQKVKDTDNNEKRHDASGAQQAALRSGSNENL